jgi:hypothetical protein
METFFSAPERICQRNSEFFSSFDAFKVKNSSDSYAVELRKKSRSDFLQSKRSKSSEIYLPEIPTEIQIKINKILNELPTLEKKLLYISNMIQSEFIGMGEKSYYFFYCFNMIKSTNIANLFSNLGYLDLIKSNIDQNNEILVKQITRSCVNITTAAPEYCSQMIGNGLLDKIILLIDRFEGEIRENCLWAISNSCLNCYAINNYLVKVRFQNKLYCILESESNLKNHIYIILGQMSKIIKDVNEINTLFKTLINEINIKSSIQSFSGCLWGLNSLTSLDSDRIDLIINQEGLLDEIIMNSINFELNISFPCFEILGNISSSTNSHTQRLLDCNILSAIQYSLDSSYYEIKKSCYFALSNIAAGTACQLKQLFEYDGLIKQAIKGLLDPNSFVRAEAWHVFVNISKFKNKDFLLSLIDLGITISIPKALNKETDPKVLKLGTVFCLNLLLAGEIEGENTVVPIFEASGCFEVISKIRNCGNSYCEEIAEKIIDTFYFFY